MDNLEIWESVQETDPDYTKHFNRGGGFSGTSVNGTWLQKQATKVFGPKGLGWGVNIVNESYQQGATLDEHNRAIIHVVQIELWYVVQKGGKAERGTITQFGQTTFVGKNKYGLYTDEEAPKKSLTDATTKALSELGFSADIFLGMYDDNKYVSDLRQKKEKENAPPYTEEQRDRFIAIKDSGNAFAMYLFRASLDRKYGEEVYPNLYNSFEKDKTRHKAEVDTLEKEGAGIFSALLEVLPNGDSLAINELVEDESTDTIAMLKFVLNTTQKRQLETAMAELNED